MYWPPPTPKPPITLHLRLNYELRCIWVPKCKQTYVDVGSKSGTNVDTSFSGFGWWIWRLTKYRKLLSKQKSGPRNLCNALQTRAQNSLWQLRNLFSRVAKTFNSPHFRVPIPLPLATKRTSHPEILHFLPRIWAGGNYRLPSDVWDWVLNNSWGIVSRKINC